MYSFTFILSNTGLRCRYKSTNLTCKITKINCVVSTSVGISFLPEQQKCWRKLTHSLFFTLWNLNDLPTIAVLTLLMSEDTKHFPGGSEGK